MNLQVLLEVQVSHLSLVVHLQELGQHGVGDDAALEVGVKAVVALHVLGNKLGHLSLRALLTALQTHKGAELIGERALDQEGVVCTAGLPGSLLLRGHVGRVDLALLLGVTLLLLGDLCSLLGCTHSLTNLGRKISRQSLQGLSELGQQSIRALGCSGGLDDGRYNRGRHGGDNNLRLGGGLLGGSSLLRGGGGRSSGGRGGGGGLGLLGGLLVSGHLVCLSGRYGGGHF